MIRLTALLNCFIVVSLPIIIASVWTSVDYFSRQSQIFISILVGFTWLYFAVCKICNRLDTFTSNQKTCQSNIQIYTPEDKAIPVDDRESGLDSFDDSKNLVLVNPPNSSSLADLSDSETVLLEKIRLKQVAIHQLESFLKPDYQKAVFIRRKYLESKLPEKALKSLPFENYDYSLVSNACCENVLGYVPVPVGYAGPLKVDGQDFFVPLATTEGALVASTNRGCRAVTMCGGVKTHLIDDFMSRAPVIEFDCLDECVKFKYWLEKPSNFRIVKQMFDSTSRFLSLKTIKTKIVDHLVFLRFCASTGDAMGMNMVSKATETVLNMLCEKYFPHKSMRVVSLSGNYCSDKKSSAINWICGRGKNVIAEATISKEVVENVLKTNVASLVHLHVSKNLIGSALAGVSGGFNAHAANIVTAVFLACGQDVAQNVSSSQCLTSLSETKDGQGNLRVSCTMPCLEVGTVGGGTILPAQKACLQMLGCAGGHAQTPGANAARLARVICATVVAGELSLLSALCSKDLVRSHMRHNRSALQLCATPATVTSQAKPQSADESSVTSPLNKALELAASAASSLHPESCSKVLT